MANTILLVDDDSAYLSKRYEKDPAVDWKVLSKGAPIQDFIAAIKELSAGLSK